MRRKLISGPLSILAIAAASVALAACGSGGSTETSSTGGSEGSGDTTASSKICAPEKTIGYLDVYAGSPIEQSIDELTKEAVNELGWNLKFVDGQANYTKMAAAVQNFVNEKVDMIIVASVDAAPIRQGLEAAKSAGIPVVEIGGGALDPQHLYTAIYNEDEEKLGVMMGEYIAKSVPEAKIADLQTTFNYTGQARDKGLKKAIAASGGSAEIVASQQVNAAEEVPSTEKAMTDMLTAHPEINSVFAVFDGMGKPATSVLRTQGSSAKLFSTFATPTNLELFEANELTALVDDNLPLTAAVALDQFLKHEGSEFEKNAVEKAGGLGYRITTSADEIYETKETLAPFLKEWAQEYPCK